MPASRRFRHETFGVVDDCPGFGLGCVDCGYDAHAGACRLYFCKSCGVECSESGCSKHPGSPRVETVERKDRILDAEQG